MSTYEPSQSAHFERLLARRKEELEQAFAALREGDPSDQTHEAHDFKDVALRHTDTDMDELQAHRIQTAQQRVAAARKRLADGHFGLCLECGQALDLRRLQVLPEAELCTRCQASHEPPRP